MDEVEINIWIAATVALVLWIARLKWVNRKLRKQIAGAPAPIAEVPVVPVRPEREDEVERLRARVAVLERITVEKENSLAREIEQLRHG